MLTPLNQLSDSIARLLSNVSARSPLLALREWLLNCPDNTGRACKTLKMPHGRITISGRVTQRDVRSGGGWFGTRAAAP